MELKKVVKKKTTTSKVTNNYNRRTSSKINIVKEEKIQQCNFEVDKLLNKKRDSIVLDKKEINKVESKKYKKRKKLILSRVFSLVFMVMFIVSLFMSINAFAETLPFNIKSADIQEKSEGTTGTINSFSNDEILNDITFHKLNDYVTYKVVLKSNLEKEVTILSITDDNENPYIEYQHDNHENEKVSAGSQIEFVVKALYKNELTDLTKREQTNNVKFTIKYLDEDNVKETEIIVNPKTGDNIHISYILLIISSTGLIVCIAIDKKRKYKKISKVQTFIITGLLLSPIIVKAATISFNFTLKTNMNIFDKAIVTYEVEGNEDTLINRYGIPITGLETPTKNGYTFSGWTYEDGSEFDPTEPITDDIKVIANFSIDDYRISYDLDGGTTATNNPTTYKITDRILLVEPTKDHYTFIGWEGTDLTEPTKNVVIENKTGNRSYVAKYTPVNYTISYTGLTDAEKIALNNKTEYNIETASFNLNNPEDRVDSDGDKTEIFAGWKEGTTTSTTITLPNTNSMGNKTYEAVWTPASDTIYRISYELYNGTTATDNPTEFTKKTETFTLVNPTKTGYQFKGWSGTDLTGDENTTVNVEKGTRKNLSFEANYIANNYQVKFDKNGGTGTMNNQSLTYDVETNLNDNLYTREGYTFKGWNTEEDGSGTHYANKGAVSNLTSEKDKVVTLYAEWEANQYTITFNGNVPTGQTLEGTMENVSMVYDTPKTLPLNMYSVLGYAFDSWNTKADGTGEKINNGSQVNNLATSGTVTLYAQWAVTPYTVIFNKNNSNATGSMENQEIAYNQPANLNNLGYELTGYNFKEWNTEINGSGDSYSNGQRVINLDIDGIVNLYAIWEPKQFNINFEINTDDPNASGTMNLQTVTYDETTTISENKFTRTGYAFDGWNTQADGQGTHYDDEQDITNTISENDITLYAEWAVTPYTVIFDKNDTDATGTMENQEIAYGVAANLSINAYTKENYKFMGWSTTPTGNVVYNDQALVKNLDIDGEVTLYAKWKELSSTLNHGNSIQTTLNDISSTATAFIRYNGTPDWNNIQNRKTISTQSSEFPVYAWLGDDGETIYWWSEVPHPKLNADSSKMFNGMSTLKTIEISDFDASNVTNMGVMFNGCSSLEELDINGWNTASVRNMSSMFGGCKKLEDDDLESIQANLNTSNVTSMNAMFQGCASLVNIELDNFDTGNVKDMAGMFKNCTNAKSIDLSNFNTKELTTVRTSSQASMFDGCTSLESIDVSGWTNEKLTDMGNMFSNLSNVKHINLTNFKTDNVTNMSRMFDSSTKLESLDVSSFNTSKVTSMMQMFFGHKYDVLDLSNFDFHSLEKCGAYGGSNVIIEYGSIKKVYLGKIDASSINGGSIGFGGRNVATTKFYINDDSDVNIQSFIDSNGDIGFNGIVAGQNGTKVSDHGAKNYEYYRIDDPDNGKPGYFWKRNSQYIRYNGNGADNSEYETMTSHYLDNTGSLKKNAFARAGYTFTGWNTKADGSGDSYTDEQLMSNIVEANTTTPLTLYAQWN